MTDVPDTASGASGVLVTGSAGLLGSALVRAGATGLTRAALDITDDAAVAEALDRRRPRAVINAAAMAVVDRCDTEPDRAWAVNAEAPGRLALACAARGVRLVHISTDYVLTGPDTPGYRLTEDDPPDPRSTYARAKLAGEQAVLAAGQTAVRVQWVYGDRRFFAFALERLRTGKPLKLVTDQVGVPTPAVILAPALLACARAAPTGLYHLACAGEATPWQWLSAAAALEGLPMTASPTTRAELGGASRPARSCLDSSRFTASFGISLPPWNAALRQMLGR